MRNMEKFRAIGLAIAMMARTKVTEENVEANKVIALTPLLKQWAEGVFSIGDVCVYEGHPYKCVQAHDSTDNPTWNPAEATSLFAGYHATAAMYAQPYAAPTGAHDAYMKGEFMAYTDGVIYECLVDATVYAPDVLPANWKAVE